MSFKIEKRVFEVLDMGTYAATVKTVEKAEGVYGDQVRFTFALDDSDATLLAWASASYSAKSKLGRWTQALLGTQPDEFDSDAVIGKPCRITVLVKTRDDGSQYNKVDEVQAPKAKKPKPEPEPEVMAGIGEPLPF